MISDFFGRGGDADTRHIRRQRYGIRSGSGPLSYSPPDDPHHIWHLVRSETVDWDAVKTRAESHGNEAAHKWINGPVIGLERFRSTDNESTLLHHVVVSKNPPVEALRAVIRAFPKALTINWHYSESEAAFCPLGLACETNASVDTIRTILQEIGRVMNATDASNEDLRNKLTPSKVLFNNEFWYTWFRLEHMRLFLEELPLPLFTRMEWRDARSCMYDSLVRLRVCHSRRCLGKD